MLKEIKPGTKFRYLGNLCLGISPGTIVTFERVIIDDDGEYAEVTIPWSLNHNWLISFIATDFREHFTFA